MDDPSTHIAALRLALRRDPHDLHVIASLARALMAEGRLNEARVQLGVLARLRPDDLALRFELARLDAARGKWPEALKVLQEAAAAWPQAATVRRAIGDLHMARGQPDRAEDAYRKALALDPSLESVHTSLGTSLFGQGRHEEAATAYQEAVHRSADDVEAANGLGAAWLALGRPDDAVFQLQATAARHPDHRATWINLGQALRAVADFAGAVDAHRRAVALDDNSAEAHDELALSLRAAHRPDEAMTAVDTAIALDPRLPLAHVHRGNLLAERNDHAGAIEAFRAALRLAPKLALARWNLSLSELALGRFADGWRNYEARWDCPEFPSPRRHFDRPRLTSTNAAKGKRVLVHAEQGLGDTIQFCRFLPALAATGATVIAEVPATLAPLVSRLPDIAVTVAGEPLPPFDAHLPMLSLPLLLERFAPDGTTVPYLGSPEPRSPGTVRRIGVVWAGGRAHANDRRRSLPLAALAPLFAVDGVEWVGLQKEIPEPDRATFDALVARHPQLLDGTRSADFGRTADLMATLDGVVAVDTAVAHLAGALALPTHLLLPFAADFRWMTGTTATDWYPTMSLHRASVMGDWASPIAAVVDRLRAAR